MTHAMIHTNQDYVILSMRTRPPVSEVPLEREADVLSDHAQDLSGEYARPDGRQMSDRKHEGQPEVGQYNA